MTSIIRNIFLGAWVLCAFHASAASLVPYRIKDLSPGTTRVLARPAPGAFATYGPIVYFAAIDVRADDVMWRSDGTVAGTYTIYDGRPEPHPVGFDAPPAQVGGFLYYGVETPDATSFLCKTDGTTPGTQIVTTIPRWYGGAGCGDGLLCFAAGGSRIGVTDGTAAGTKILLSTAPGVETQGRREMITLGRRVFFNAYDEQNGQCTIAPAGVGGEKLLCGELWTSDGTAAGTHLFADLNPGPGPSNASNMFVSSSGKLYFNAVQPGSLDSYPIAWVSDGTPQGTRMLSAPPGDWGFPGFFSEFKGHVYFTHANGDLYETDGTPEGTVSLRSRFGIPSGTILIHIGTLGDRMLFSVFNGGPKSLWWYDGVHPAQKFFDIGLSMTPFGMLPSNGLYYFVTGESNYEMWATDGTTDGTKKLFRLPPTGGTVAPYAQTSDHLFYATGGGFVFATDGTEAGTQQLDLSTPTAGDSSWGSLVLVGGKAYSASYKGMLVTDGTAGGTLILDQRDVSSPFEREGLVYFAQNGTSGFTLWRTDGTPQGTFRVRDWLGTGLITETPAFIGSNVIFADQDDTPMSDLTRHDPDGKNERLGLKGVLTGLRSVAGGVVCWYQISADIQVGVRELAFTDGTKAGTRIVAGGFYSPGLIARVGDRVFFGAKRDASAPLTLWVSDLTADGTRQVKELPPGLSLSDTVSPLGAFRDLLLFHMASPGSVSNTYLGIIWRSDGTAEGTYPLSDQDFYTFLAGSSQLTLLHFTYPGFEIWSSDGTRAGTKKQDSVAAGVPSAPFLLPGGGVGIPYTATPHELRIRDPLAGDVAVVDGGALSMPVGNAIGLNGKLLFGSGRPATGPGLWAVSLTGPPPVQDVASVRVDYLGIAAVPGGRGAVFRVHMDTGAAAVPTVIATTMDGTLTSDKDYVPFTRQVVFETDHEVTLVVPLRKHAETGGTLSVVLSLPTNAVIGQGIATAQVPKETRRRTVSH